MDLKVSYNWLREYVGTSLSPAELAREVSLHGPSIERIHEMTPQFERVVVGEITAIAPHPNADKLQLATVNIGDEMLSIVCGAPNIAVGQRVPVALVGGRVGDMEIRRAKIRDIESYGMLCSLRELGLADDHSGIFVLPAYAELGAPLEKLLAINDTILDTEVTGNRTDLMGMVGLAREIAAITESKFIHQTPRPSLKVAVDPLPLKVTLKDKRCRRYSAIALSGIRVEPSPLWLQTRLLTAGIRPINNIVDITNYILLEYGQPMHAFDYSAVSKGHIIIRAAQPEESLHALDGKAYALTDRDVIIADATGPLALGGVMGGENSGVTETTTAIIFESANFDPLTIRRTARALNLHSASSSLFEKNLHPASTGEALLRAIALAQEIAGGRIASVIIEQGMKSTKPRAIKVNPDHIRTLIGIDIADKEINQILKRLGLIVTTAKKSFSVEIPWWRDYDIEGEHDIAEEVARLYGYHRLAATLPTGQIPPVSSQRRQFALEQHIKNTLRGAGLSETYTYSLISADLLAMAGLSATDHIALANPLSTEFSHLRTTLIPSLLESASTNSGQRSALSFFELAHVYIPRENDLPDEHMRLAIVLTGTDAHVLLRTIRGLWEGIIAGLHIPDATIVPTGGNTAWWLPGSSGALMLADAEVGNLGVISPRSRQKFGLKQQAVALECRLAPLLAAARSNPTFTPLAKFPSITLDLSFEIARDVSYQDIVTAITGADPLLTNIEFLSIYEGAKITTSQKALAIRLEYRHAERTLELAEAQSAHDRVVARLKKAYTISIR